MMNSWRLFKNFKTKTSTKFRKTNEQDFRKTNEQDFRKIGVRFLDKLA